MIVVVGLLINRSGRLLIQQRPETSKRGGLWEFPGGKVEPGETMRDALKREWMEELGLNINVADLIDEQIISFPEIKDVLLPLFRVHLMGHQPIKMNDGQKVKWASLKTAMSYPGVPTMSAFESALRSYCGSN